jgi:putative heme iron utilization protein
MTDEAIEAARGALARLRAARSLVLATLNEAGEPEASYAPFVIDEAGRFIVFVSRLSSHTANLLERGSASVLLIEDEADSAQIYARRRVSYRCNVERLDRAGKEGEVVLQGLAARHGEIIEVLRGLADFELVALRPRSGQLVVGFGRAYRLGGDRLDQLEHISSGA